MNTNRFLIGLLIAAWSSTRGLVVKGGIWLFVFPISCVPVWWWTQRPVSKKAAHPKGNAHQPSSASETESERPVVPHVSSAAPPQSSSAVQSSLPTEATHEEV